MDTTDQAEETGKGPDRSEDFLAAFRRAADGSAPMLSDAGPVRKHKPASQDIVPNVRTQAFSSYSVILDCSDDPADPEIVRISDALADFCAADLQGLLLSELPTGSLLAGIGEAARQIVEARRRGNARVKVTDSNGGQSLLDCQFVPVTGSSGEPDHVMVIFDEATMKGLHSMASQKLDEEVLELDNELIVAEEEGGEDSIVGESGVLLLADEAPDDPPVRKIEVGPRRTGSLRLAAQAEQHRREVQGWQAAIDANRAARLAEIARDDAARQIEDLSDEEPDSAEESHAPEQASALASALADAHALVSAYRSIEARTRSALYDALGRAHDIALLATDHPRDYAAALEQAGIEVHERAPLVALAKLVFGKDYDKTRLTEFATVIGYCLRKNVGAGQAAAFIGSTEGGIKRIVEMERLLRQGEDVGTGAQRTVPRKSIAKGLSKIATRGLEDMDDEGDEYVLVMARRLPGGGVGVLGEIPRDIALLEKAARSLLAEQGRKTGREGAAAEEIASSD